MPTNTILIIGIAFAFVLLLVGLITSVREENRSLEERLGRYWKIRPLTALHAERATPLTDWLNTAARGSHGLPDYRKNCTGGCQLRVGEYLALMIICAFGAGFIVWFCW